MKRMLLLLIVAVLCSAVYNQIGYSSCGECTNTIVVFQDVCDDGCEYTYYWWSGHACCDGVFGFGGSCPTHAATANYEIWSLSEGTCTSPNTLSCPSTAGGAGGHCINSYPYSKTSYDDCDLGNYIGTYSQTLGFCGAN